MCACMCAGLQEKYTRVMRDKADLIDKSERLEHIVLQLQGETDTIGQSLSNSLSKFHYRGYLYML